MNPVKLKHWKIPIFIVLLLLAVQLFYYAAIILAIPCRPPRTDLVLVFSNDPVRVSVGINLARKCGAAYFMITDKGLNDIQADTKKYGYPGTAKIILEGKAGTTDQNSRYTAPMIRNLHVQNVILVTSWFHMPRALFLARLYLVGAPVKIYPYAADHPSSGWWHTIIFWQEYVKFWGSLGRVVLNWFGIDNWPAHS